MVLYREPREIIKKLPYEGSAEMSEWQHAFLCGLLKETRPRKILEIGVSAGGTTAVMLNCLSLLKCRCHFTSVDISETYYKNPNYKSGFLAEYAKNLIENYAEHEVKIGIIPDLIDEIGGDIDFLVIDTMHLLPGEILDFLVCLPYLSDNAVVCLHDVILHGIELMSDAYATQVLLDCITADKIPIFGEDKEFGYPNIAAFRINADTKKYIYDVFSALLLTWQYEVEDVHLDAYRDKYVECGYSDECIKVFDCARRIFFDAAKKKREASANRVKSLVNHMRKLFGKKVYIYGAGEVGRMAYDIFHECFEFMGYIVSDDQQSGEGIYKLSEVAKEMKENEVVFVAVTPDARMKEIEQNLSLALIRNVEYIDKELWDLLRVLK